MPQRELILASSSPFRRELLARLRERWPLSPLDSNYRGEVVQTMPRLRKEDEHKIEYRHVIGWLVRKPGAFARYRYREDLFPSVTFRRAYDRLLTTWGERADVEYLRILKLAATAGEHRVASVLARLLDDTAVFDYIAVQSCVDPPAPQVPVIRIPAPDLRAYDALLAGAVA